MYNLKEIINKYKTKKVVKAGSWYIIGQFLQKGILVLLLPILTRLLPTTEEYGILSLYNTWSVILGIIITLDLWASVNRAKFDYDNQQFNEFFSSTVFWGTTFFVIGMFIFSFIPGGLIQTIFGLNKILVFYALLGGYLTFPYNSILARWTVEYKYKRYFITILLSTIANLLLSIILILLMKNNKYLGRIYGVLIINGVISILILSSVFKNPGHFLKKDYFRYAFAFSAPLIIHHLAQAILSQFDRIMIDKYIGKSEVGIYNFAHTLGSIIFILFTATNTAFVPWFFEKMKEEKFATIKNRSRIYLFGFTLITILTILISPLLVRIIGPRNYWEGTAIVPIIMAGYFFMFLYTFCYTIEAYYKKTHYLSLGTIIAALFNVALNYLLIPKYGYVASAWTAFISYALLFFFHYIIVKFIIKRVILNFITLSMCGLIVFLISMIVAHFCKGI